VYRFATAKTATSSFRPSRGAAVSRKLQMGARWLPLSRLSFREAMMDDRNARAAAAKSGSPYLNTSQAAHYLVCSQRTLERMRTLGLGPKYRKHGRHVRYLIDDLDNWSLDHEHQSTSEGSGLAVAQARS
jgi:hypothetical protein